MYESSNKYEVIKAAAVKQMSYEYSLLLQEILVVGKGLKNVNDTKLTRMYHTAWANFRVSGPGFRTGGGDDGEETERCRLEGRRGISSVQADVRTIRGAPQRIVRSACQP